MEIKHSVIDESNTIHACHSVVILSDKTELTMYGEIVNGRVNSKATNPSFWNSSVFQKLTESEQKDVRECVNISLSNLELPENY